MAADYGVAGENKAMQCLLFCYCFYKSYALLVDFINSFNFSIHIHGGISMLLCSAVFCIFYHGKTSCFILRRLLALRYLLRSCDPSWIWNFAVDLHLEMTAILKKIKKNLKIRGFGYAGGVGINELEDRKNLSKCGFGSTFFLDAIPQVDDPSWIRKLSRDLLHRENVERLENMRKKMVVRGFGVKINKMENNENLSECRSSFTFDSDHIPEADDPSWIRKLSIDPHQENVERLENMRKNMKMNDTNNLRECGSSSSSNSYQIPGVDNPSRIMNFPMYQHQENVEKLEQMRKKMNTPRFLHMGGAKINDTEDTKNLREYRSNSDTVPGADNLARIKNLSTDLHQENMEELDKMLKNIKMGGFGYTGRVKMNEIENNLLESCSTWNSDHIQGGNNLARIKNPAMGLHQENMEILEKMRKNIEMRGFGYTGRVKMNAMEDTKNLCECISSSSSDSDNILLVNNPARIKNLSMDLHHQENVKILENMRKKMEMRGFGYTEGIKRNDREGTKNLLECGSSSTSNYDNISVVNNPARIKNLSMDLHHPENVKILENMRKKMEMRGFGYTAGIKRNEMEGVKNLCECRPSSTSNYDHIPVVNNPPRIKNLSMDLHHQENVEILKKMRKNMEMRRFLHTGGADMNEMKNPRECRPSSTSNSDNIHGVNNPARNNNSSMDLHQENMGILEKMRKNMEKRGCRSGSTSNSCQIPRADYPAWMTKSFPMDLHLENVQILEMMRKKTEMSEFEHTNKMENVDTLEKTKKKMNDIKNLHECRSCSTTFNLSEVNNPAPRITDEIYFQERLADAKNIMVDPLASIKVQTTGIGGKIDDRRRNILPKSPPIIEGDMDCIRDPNKENTTNVSMEKKDDGTVSSEFQEGCKCGKRRRKKKSEDKNGWFNGVVKKTQSVHEFSKRIITHGLDFIFSGENIKNMLKTIWKNTISTIAGELLHQLLIAMTRAFAHLL